MAKIEKLKKGTATIYPATIPQAVVDPTSGKSAREELDEKANHGYDSAPKTLKEVDEAKVDTTSIVGETGQGETSVMHQKAVTDELGTKASHGYAAEETPKTLKQVDDSVSQLAGEVSLLDAVQGAKIKDIESIISTMNPNQSAQLSVSGVSPLSLPKNAANGGMSVKLEGLTEDVGGVITHFEPTGRVRSVGKNLFDKRNVLVGKYIIPASGLATNNLLYSSDYIKIKPATTYKIRGVTAVVTAGATTLGYYDADKVYISGSYLSLTTLPSFTTPANSAYLIFSMLKPDLDTAQLEMSAVSTPYEPYRETALYLTAPELRSNGTVKDEIRKGANGYELVKRISDVDGSVLTTPEIIPISYGGVLNSASNGTVYHEPIIADAGVYDTKMDILLTDYPIATIEEIIKHENGVDTYLNVATAVIAGDGLSFTHPDLTSGDLVLFTYAFDKESTNGNITATFYDSNVVKIDTETGKAYKIEDVVTNGVLTRTLTEV